MPDDPEQSKDATSTGDAAKAAAKPAPSAATPAKTKPTAKKGGDDIARRAFLTTLGFAWAAFTAAMGACTAATGRLFFPNVLYEPPTRFKVGVVSDFTIDAVDERYKQAYGVWVVRNSTGFYALSTTCTHLGCTPNWLSAERKFKCPCHGSGFYIDGINFEGPAPRPLERYMIGQGDDGQIFVDKSRRFQQEKGQWEDPDSFLRLA